MKRMWLQRQRKKPNNASQVPGKQQRASSNRKQVAFRRVVWRKPSVPPTTMVALTVCTCNTEYAPTPPALINVSLFMPSRFLCCPPLSSSVSCSTFRDQQSSHSSSSRTIQAFDVCLTCCSRPPWAQITGSICSFAVCVRKLREPHQRVVHVPFTFEMVAKHCTVW